MLDKKTRGGGKATRAPLSVEIASFMTTELQKSAASANRQQENLSVRPAGARRRRPTGRACYVPSRYSSPRSARMTGCAGEPRRNEATRRVGHRGGFTLERRMRNACGGLRVAFPNRRQPTPSPRSADSEPRHA